MSILSFQHLGFKFVLEGGAMTVQSSDYMFGSDDKAISNDRLMPKRKRNDRPWKILLVDDEV